MKTDYEEGELLEFNEKGETKLFGLDYTEMVYVEKGTFNIGDNSSGESDEKEASISFDKGYFIGKYPVTQQLYERITGINPSHFKGKNRPVEYVSWDDICVDSKDNVSFLRQLNNQFSDSEGSTEGKFALPSEAQWEYAARGGKAWDNPKFVYAGSNNIHDVAWFEGNANRQTMPVGLKQPNALGIYDMSGNVFEWCQGWYVSDYTLIPPNGEAFEKSGTLRVLRGGGWYFQAQICRVAYRSDNDPEHRNYYYGFRLVFFQVLA
ncbi:MULTISPECIES: formylglycine-generating enzyme family protein [unclassified Arcicella]|uniref:formylglycine-generating enzyme family protein n=1 Tax=unclassified Arcicella TaxID=2644986 RepID=UPI0028556FE2|nr:MULTISPECIES: formylglycine-generating enzyme family protein [unclassified Arcicella]MDR6565016.1 formylglycine-generating enzyme required for sulfatase activity [Arcicella sp. BE51]MDR6814829.1 formylglycine-generating enzyme required for sulfatase activity [Arcicella sp. BE140]MDR6826283.1 formylglycine-generating enzyme required for sulfatase activity [Arcicella sp. BE139]